MALSSFNDMSKGKSLIPDTEMSRINYITANRRLFNGDFRELGIEDVDAEGNYGLKLNWFKRVATFYPEFMMADNPDVLVEGNERFQEYIENIGTDMFMVLQKVNVDVLRFGLGIVATHPNDPLVFQRFEPDAHYEVADSLGNLLGDIVIRVRGAGVGGGANPGVGAGAYPLGVLSFRNAVVDIYKYPIDGGPTWEVFRFDGNSLGERLHSQDLPERTGRQVVPIAFTIDSTSLFDDMKGSMGEISRAATALSKTIRRNSNPHLYGPNTMLVTESGDSVALDSDGMFLPLQQGDESPGYLQWDSSLESVTQDISMHIDNALFMSGLTSSLFSSSLTGGVVTGVALRRLLLPFVARLDSLANHNREAILNLLELHNNNRMTQGDEVFSWERRDITVDWKYEEVFRDDGSKRDDAEPKSDDDDTTGGSLGTLDNGKESQ